MSKKILVCDDSVIMRKLVSDCLLEAGYEILDEACNGKEAVEKYQAHRPDAVTMDIVMPKFDGLYALDHIMEIDPTAKVIVISALNQTKLISEAIRKGAHDFLAKPFLPEQLQKTVDTCLSAV